MRDLATIRRWMKEAVDHDYHNLLYTLQLFVSGDCDAIRRAVEGKYIEGAWSRSEGELPSFPDVMPGIGPEGVQNHGLVNARIMVQGLNMEPEFIFDHPDAVIRQYNAAFIRKRWTEGKWRHSLYRAGMEFEANGLSSVRLGVSDGKVSLRQSPNMDTLWDRSRGTPDQWRWVATRNRLTPEEAEEIYGGALSKKDLETLTKKEVLQAGTGTASLKREPMLQVVEWSYYDADCHVVFLGSVHGNDSIVLALDESYEYRKATRAGPNPFGIVPHRFWIDSYAPGVRRPVARAETTIRLVAMLNKVEKAMMDVFDTGKSLTFIDSSRVDPKLRDAILEARSCDDINSLIPFAGGNIEDLLKRVPAEDIPSAYPHIRMVLKEEINAATGVQDMMRGQALSGEKTKFEVESYNDQAGIQGRHVRETFADFCEGVVSVARAIASQHDTADTTLILPDFGEVKTSQIPAKAMLSVEMSTKMSPESVIFKTDNQRRQEAMQEFTVVWQPLMERGAADPMKILDWIGRVFGHKNPVSDFGVQQQAAAPGQVPPEILQQLMANPQMAQALAQHAQMPPQAA